MNDPTIPDMIHDVLFHGFNTFQDMSSGLLFGLAMMELLLFFYRSYKTKRGVRRIGGGHE
ncbi:MAG: hypothetical protein CMP06_04235 [Xanthomonadales bacterium]|nr:hypothetical protein [Xanthomonadales bacterium]